MLLVQRIRQLLSRPGTKYIFATIHLFLVGVYILLLLCNRNLAIGIGIQNFPEGLAVSLPLHAAGFSMMRSFWYGQLSGMVEPIFGILGAVAVTVASIILPYALSFAAGAMIYIVADDILPEAHTRYFWMAIYGLMY